RTGRPHHRQVFSGANRQGDAGERVHLARSHHVDLPDVLNVDQELVDGLPRRPERAHFFSAPGRFASSILTAVPGFSVRSTRNGPMMTFSRGFRSPSTSKSVSLAMPVFTFRNCALSFAITKTPRI